MSQKVCSKEELDSTLENLERNIVICWDCVSAHYPNEFKQKKGFPVAMRRCNACGKRGDCTWAGLWRPLIYKSKTTKWLINQFEKDILFYNSITLLRTKGSCAVFELAQRGEEDLLSILDYIKATSATEKEEWFYFFEQFAHHHTLLRTHSHSPKNFSEWEKLLTA